MRILLGCLLISLLHINVYAQPAADARIYVRSEGEIYAGQMFNLYIEAKTETYFLSTPSFPHIALEEAIAIQPEQLGTSFSERIGGTLFAGVRQRFLVSSHKPGLLEIPAYTIEFSAASTDSSRAPVPISVVTAPVTISISMPPGLESIQRVAITPDLSIEQQFDKPLEDLRVGDAFTRSIILQANGAMGFMLPATEFEELEGLTIYSSQPRFEDSSARGRTLGRRIDSATYLLQRDGSFELPSVSVDWFDLENNVLKTLELESVEFEVAVNPSLDSVLISSVVQDENSRLLVAVINFLNWSISHWIEIVSIVMVISVATYSYQKYAQRFYHHLVGSIHKLVLSESWVFAVLVFASLFRSSATTKHKLLIWMLRNDNVTFNKSKAYQEIRISYQKSSPGPIGKLNLARDLLMYRYSRSIGESYDSATNLNP